MLLTIMSRRQQSLLFFLGILIINKLTASLFNKEEMNDMLKSFTSVLAIIIIHILFIGFMIFSLNNMRKVEIISPETYPIEATEYLKNNLDVENIKLFNEYNIGSYLLFNEIPVFIDSRADVYDPEFNKLEDDIFRDYMNLKSGVEYYESKLEYYGITHLLLYKNSALEKQLKIDGNYNELYSDNIFIIYERVSANI